MSKLESAILSWLLVRRSVRGTAHPGPPAKPSHPAKIQRFGIEWRTTPSHRVWFTSLPQSAAPQRISRQQTLAVCPSGQREQTVNLPASPSQVRILAPPHGTKGP